MKATKWLACVLAWAMVATGVGVAAARTIVSMPVAATEDGRYWATEAQAEGGSLWSLGIPGYWKDTYRTADNADAIDAFVAAVEAIKEEQANPAAAWAWRVIAAFAEVAPMGPATAEIFEAMAGAEPPEERAIAAYNAIVVYTAP